MHSNNWSIFKAIKTLFNFIEGFYGLLTTLFIESMLKLLKWMTDVAINHIHVVIKIFLENYLQALPVHVSVNENGTNSVLIENHTHKLITYTTFWLTVHVHVNKKKQEQWFYRKSLLHVLLDSL